MNTEWIGSLVCIDVPDGFRTMSGKELEQACSGADGMRWGTWDRENHVMITVMWKEYPLLLSKLADLKAVSRRNEQLNSRGYAGHGYRCEGFFSLAAGDRHAEGYKYTYSLGDVRQCAETVLFKQNRTIFSITCTGRAENREADHETFAGSLPGSVSGSRPFPAFLEKEQGDAHRIDAARTVPSVRAAADHRFGRKMIRRKAAYGCGFCRQEMGKYGRKNAFDPFVWKSARGGSPERKMGSGGLQDEDRKVAGFGAGVFALAARCFLYGRSGCRRGVFARPGGGSENAL